MSCPYLLYGAMTISSVAVTMRREQSCLEIVTDMVVCVEWPFVAEPRPLEP
jgi:hypothetical protein